MSEFFNKVDNFDPLKVTTAADIDPQESAAKLRLDHAEFEEHRASLQREVAAANFNEDGGLVLVIPEGDPDVNAFIKELAGIKRDPPADLKTARRCLQKARDSYQTRVSFRLDSGPRDYKPWFRRFVSLASILIVRAEAIYLHKAILGLEHTQRTKKQNERAAQLAPRYVIIDDHPVRVRRERERPSS